MSLINLPGRTNGLDAVVVAPDAWLANRRRTRAWAALAAGWSVAILVLSVLPGHLPWHGPAAALAGVLALDLVLITAGAVLAWRVARSGVWIGTDGIVVRGPFATVQVSLAEAAGFSPGLQGRGGNGVPCPMLARVPGPGRRCPGVGVWALGRRNIWFRYRRIADELEPLCAELDGLVARLRPRPS